MALENTNTNSDKPKKYTATIKKSVYNTIYKPKVPASPEAKVQSLYENTESQTQNNTPVNNNTIPTTEQTAGEQTAGEQTAGTTTGMGDLKFAESQEPGFFDRKPTQKDLQDLYVTPSDKTKAPVYDYKKLDDKPILKKIYKERSKNPDNREPTYPLAEPEETTSGSIVSSDMSGELQQQENELKQGYLDKINSGEINLPPFMQSLPIDQQLSYVGATYQNNPLFTAISTLTNPLLHLDNLVRTGMNKVLNTDYKMLSPAEMTGEDEDDKMITGGTELITSLIPLGASIKGANYLLKGLTNPYLKKILSTGLGFVINTQPELLDNLTQNKIELRDYAIQSAKDFVTGLSFGALPHGTPFKYDLPYQTIVPTMIPVISDLIEGKPIDEKELMSGFMSNLLLGFAMNGSLPKETKVAEITKKLKNELSGYALEQQTPELVNSIVMKLLPPAKVENTETLSRIKPGETTTETIPASKISKLFGGKDETIETKTAPSIEQVKVPGNRDVIQVDESGNAKVIPEREIQEMSIIKLTADQLETMKNNGMTAAEIKAAEDNINKPIYPRTTEVKPEAMPEVKKTVSSEKEKSVKPVEVKEDKISSEETSPEIKQEQPSVQVNKKVDSSTKPETKPKAENPTEKEKYYNAEFNAKDNSFAETNSGSIYYVKTKSDGTHTVEYSDDIKYRKPTIEESARLFENAREFKGDDIPKIKTEPILRKEGNIWRVEKKGTLENGSTEKKPVLSEKEKSVKTESVLNPEKPVIQNESAHEKSVMLSKLTGPQLENYINGKAWEMGSRADYLQSKEYKEIVKPLQDKHLIHNKSRVNTDITDAKDKLKNKIITKAQYDKAIQNIKERGNRLSMNPIDPAVLKDFGTVGLHLIEKGIRNFAEWSKRMVKELGDKVKPHLKKLWAELNKDRTGLKDVKQGLFGGFNAESFKKAKSESKTFINPYDKKSRFEIDDSKSKLIIPEKYTTKDSEQLADIINNRNDKYFEDASKLAGFNGTWMEYKNSLINKLYKDIADRTKGHLRLSDVLDHKELYENYPNAKDIKFSFVNTSKFNGEYNPISNRIKVDNNLNGHNLKTTILHEIQHAIQKREGFAKGGSPAIFKDLFTKKEYEETINNIDKKIDDRINQLGLRERINQLVADVSDKNIDEFNRIFKEDSTLYVLEENKNWLIKNTKLAENPIESYKRLAGEIEARDVQARMNLTENQRNPNHEDYVAPYSSENISPQDAIVNFDSVISESRGPSMKLKVKNGESETFEQYKRRIAKEYGTVPSKEEYNDAVRQNITATNVENNKAADNVKNELKDVIDDMGKKTDKKPEMTFEDMRSRTSRTKKKVTANELYMDKVNMKITELQGALEGKGLKGQALMNKTQIEITNHLFNNDKEFGRFKGDQKRAIMREVKRHFKDEYRKKSGYDNEDGYEYVEQGFRDKVWNKGMKQSLNVVREMGEPGKEFADRMSKALDDERGWMGKSEGVAIDIAALTKVEKNNLKEIWQSKMDERTPPAYLNDNVKNADVIIDNYFKDIAGELKERGFTTRNKLTGDVYAFTPKKDYRPRMMNEKVNNLGITYDMKGNPKRNAEREKVLNHLVETKQVNDLASASLLLDNELSKNRIFKAGNVEYSRNETARLPDEYYITDPTESLIKYSKRVSKRISFVDAWGIDGAIEKRLLDDMRKNHTNFKFAEKLFRYENDQLTENERNAIGTVNGVKSLQALTKFSPFTTLRNSMQGFLGTTTRGNLKAGVSGVIRSFDPVARRYAKESGAIADNIESYLKESFGGEGTSKLNKLTSAYLDIIGFTKTDAINRIIAANGGLAFMEDMLKRIQKDSIWKKRAVREFKKMGLDQEAIVKRGEYTDAEKKQIMRNFSYETQFSTRPQDLPLFWSSGFGKLITQWKPFGYKMTQLIRDSVISETKKGNLFPIITYLTAYGVAGETVNYIIDNIRSVTSFSPNQDEYTDPNERTLWHKAKTGDVGGFLKRYMNNLSGLGALSMFVDVGRSLGYGKAGQTASVIAGPGISEGFVSSDEIFSPAAKYLFGYEDDFKKSVQSTLKGITNTTLRNIPGSGTLRTLGLTKAAQEYLFPKEESSQDEFKKTLSKDEKKEFDKIKQMEKSRDEAKEKALETKNPEDLKEYQRQKLILEATHKSSKVGIKKKFFDKKNELERQSIIGK